MKKSDNTKHLGSIVITKAKGVTQSLFRVSNPKETEDMSISLPCIGRVVHCHFISHVIASTGSPCL